MRLNKLSALADMTVLRRSVAKVSDEEKQLYKDAWDRCKRYPEKSTRPELELYPQDVRFLTTCISCQGPSEGSTHHPDEPDFEFPICEKCLESPFEDDEPTVAEA